MVLYTALWLSKELILYCNSESVDSVFIEFIGFNLLHTNLEQKPLFLLMYVILNRQLWYKLGDDTLDVLVAFLRKQCMLNQYSIYDWILP